MIINVYADVDVYFLLLISSEDGDVGIKFLLIAEADIKILLRANVDNNAN